MNNHLVVPVYLNQRLVFDLLAMLQGGIATVTRLERTESHENRTEEQLRSQFGLADAFGSLLKINLGGDRLKQVSGGGATSLAEDRTHTPASLFSVLRRELTDLGILKAATDSLPEPGDFVEFTAQMRKNPLVEGLDSITELFALFQVFTAQEASPKGSGNLRRDKQGGEFARLSTQLKHVSDSMKQGNTQDLVALTLEKRKVIVTLDTQFLNDPTMSDLIDGTFKVLGKVTRCVHENNESISLLRKSSLNMAPDVIEKLVAAFESLQDSKNFKIPPMEAEVAGPAFQIIPVAIFA